MSMESKTTGEVGISLEEGYKENNIKKARLQSMLAALLDDPILSDVPKKPTSSDVDTLLSLEFGSAMRINVFKLDGTIPSAMSNCSSLVHFSADDNSLRGLIPATVAAITKLQALDLVPEKIHQRSPIFLGSYDDVEEVKLLYKAT